MKKLISLLGVMGLTVTSGAMVTSVISCGELGISEAEYWKDYLNQWKDKTPEELEAEFDRLNEIVENGIDASIVDDEDFIALRDEFIDTANNLVETSDYDEICEHWANYVPKFEKYLGEYAKEFGMVMMLSAIAAIN